jgi:putative flavoprotein involved in K+ transport
MENVSMREIERIQIVVIGAGQSGLSVGYHLARRGLPFVILEANQRVGDTWRKRWDSLRLFTPARYDGLVGMPFPAASTSFPTKDQMADYLESYAKHFKLPVRTGVTVTRVSKRGDGFLVSGDDFAIEAEQVVVAMASYQQSRLPAFAKELDTSVVQLHSSEYRKPAQLATGAVLVVGAGNSGAEIALEAARNGHSTWLSGRDPGHIPFRIESFAGRYILAPITLRFVFHHLLTLKTPLGRKAQPKGVPRGGPLIRTRPKELDAGGVRRVPKTVGVRDGLPLLEDGQTLEVATVVWCTGFDPGFSWIDLPVFGPAGQPMHDRGVVAKEPGLYFTGLNFLFAMSSTMIHGAARDAEHVAKTVIARARQNATRQRVSAIDAMTSPSRTPSTTSIPSTTSPNTV